MFWIWGESIEKVEVMWAMSIWEQGFLYSSQQIGGFDETNVPSVNR